MPTTESTRPTMLAAWVYEQRDEQGRPIPASHWAREWDIPLGTFYALLNGRRRIGPEHHHVFKRRSFPFTMQEYYDGTPIPGREVARKGRRKGAKKTRTSHG